jgi:hypothetical protein
MVAGFKTTYEIDYCAKRNLQQYFSYSLAVSFIGGGNTST